MSCTCSVFSPLSVNYASVDHVQICPVAAIEGRNRADLLPCIAPMSAAEARQLFEVRLSLDPTAVELAADRRTDNDIADIRAAAGRLLPVTQKWGEDALRAHRDFHRTLYLASHNDVLIRLLDDLWDKSDRYRRIGLELPPGAEPRTVDHQEHFRILELVVAQDSQGAADLMRKHIVKSLTAAAIDALEDRERELRQTSA